MCSMPGRSSISFRCCAGMPARSAHLPGRCRAPRRGAIPHRAPVPPPPPRERAAGHDALATRPNRAPRCAGGTLRRLPGIDVTPDARPPLAAISEDAAAARLLDVITGMLRELRPAAPEPQV